MEIYLAAGYPDDAFGQIADFFKAFPDFERNAYRVYGRKEVFRHAFRLASGLESQIKGEIEILTQLKAWINSPDFPEPLKSLWDKAIGMSHDARQVLGFYGKSNNAAGFVFDDIRMRLPKKENYEIVIVGTGRVAELFARLALEGARFNFVGRKNFHKAEILADKSGGRAWRLKDLGILIGKADAIICAAKSPHYVLKKRHFEPVSRSAAQQLYIYDLSFPRAVDPSVAEIGNVSLFNLDDLTHVFNRASNG